MAMKVVKQDKYNFTYNGTPQTISLIVREGKQRRRSYMTGKMEWANVRSLSVVCSLYPKCEWFPYSDGDVRGATFSCEGWEPDRPEFKTIDKVVETLICNERGWPTKGNVDKLLKKLSVTAYEVDESMNRTLEQRIVRLERMMNRKSAKNEAADPVANAVYRAADSIRQIVNDLCKTLAYSDITNYSDVNMALKVCENTFSKEANDRFNSIFEDRENGKEF